MWQLLAKPLLGVATDAVKGFVETRKLKGEVKIAQIQAEKKKNEDIANGKIPAICAFLPFMQPHIERGFEILSGLPEYYRHLLYLACSVSLGVRAGPAALNMFKKK